MANLENAMKYQQLTQHILTKLPIRYRNHFYSWIENGSLLNQGKNVTEQGVEIAHIKYDAVLFFDEFPYREISASYLMAIIQLWLNDNDEMRDILDEYEIKFELDIVDEKIADLTFTIEFLEKLTALEDVQGNLSINNKPYRLSEIEIYIANDFSMTD
ncbi:tail completion protein R (GpR) [Volucribacter psittacicida]|uniref:Tail completion protein R (GpR) n=1 Tax=Volucribacter psittacicida TaxID=203482 RepID=A0A4V2PBV3_9PAST|nr:phage tail protein [Volucribacter psittacicida]TCJ98825.1 tail completion protein R (GpR) [Volucribacter psittacicida]